MWLKTFIFLRCELAGTVNDRYGSVLLEMEWIETEHKRNRK
mgnify:FL=1